MSDITGGNKGRTPKKADGEATTPASKRKTGNTDEDGLETPTKRRGKAKPAAKKGAVKKEAGRLPPWDHWKLSLYSNGAN